MDSCSDLIRIQSNLNQDFQDERIGRIRRWYERPMPLTHQTPQRLRRNSPGAAGSQPFCVGAATKAAPTTGAIESVSIPPQAVALCIKKSLLL